MKQVFYHIALYLLIVSCATPRGPEGGPRDEQPPAVNKFEPENLSRNFNQKNISIVFDEWIQVSNLKQQVIISPPIKPEPIISARKNELKIAFKETLDSNTTYSIFFGDAVKDNNEGNIVSNLSYVFSTGQDIDSLYISGKISTPDGSKIPDNTFVELYTHAEDSIITQQRPKYIFKVKDDGQFKINYLPEDTFKIFVLNDRNTNYLYDLPTEWIGKHDSVVFLNRPIENLNLVISLPEDKDYRIKDFNSTLSDNILTIQLNKELNPQKDTILCQNFNLDTILIFPQKHTSKYFSFFVPIDSSSIDCKLTINNIIVDSLHLKRPSKGDENNVLCPISRGGFKYSILRAYNNDQFQLLSALPIEKIYPEKIKVISEADTLELNQISINDDLWGLKISHALAEDFKGKVLFEDSSVLFKTGKYLSQSEFEIQHTSSDEYGQMSFEVQLPDYNQSYIIRLFDQDKILHHEKLISEDSVYHITLPHMISGEFYAEVIEDVNQSGTWNGASFWESRETERVYKSETFKLRPNWEDVHVVKVNFDSPQPPTESADILKFIREQVKGKRKSAAEKQSLNLESSIETLNPGSLPDFKKR